MWRLLLITKPQLQQPPPKQPQKPPPKQPQQLPPKQHLKQQRRLATLLLI